MSRWASLGFRLAFCAFLFCTVVGSWECCRPALAADASTIISETRAAQHGLERQWHTQIAMDPWKNRVTHLSYVPKSDTCPDMLFVQTENSMVFAINAETGQTLWSRLVGKPYLMSEAVDANDQVVGALNGSTLFILDRLNGRTLWNKGFRSVPATGPILSKQYAFVPYAAGCVAAYPLSKTKTASGRILDRKSESELAKLDTSPEASKTNRLRAYAETEPLLCPSLRRIDTKPILIENNKGTDRLAWVNAGGIFMGSISSDSGGMNVDYSLLSKLDFEASPAFVQSRFVQPEGAKVPGTDKLAKNVPIFGALLVAAKNGEISAIQAGSGKTLWEYHFGEPIVQPIVTIEDRAYVFSQYGTMVCFDARLGKKLWSKKGISQFVAKTKERIYVLDQLRDKLLILRASDGGELDQLSISGFTKVFCNDKSDRLFFATESGLIQSLRQRGMKKPVWYR